MRIKTKASIIITIGLIIIVTSRFISAIDAPHNTSYMNCGSCHGYEIFWVGTGSYNALCQQCHKVSSCSLEGYPDTNAPQVKTHSDSSGNALAECRTCHNPHYQRQKNYKNTDPSNYYLAKGQFTACSPGSDTSTLTYSTNPQTPFTYKSGWDVTRLTGKTDICRRTILFPNVNKLGYSYPITGVDEGTNTITVKGNACEYLSLPSNFAVIYGQYIKDSILTNEDTGTYSTVKFFDKEGTNSFADGDTTYNGVCEVCHKNTTHYMYNGTGSEQNHENISGGKASGGTNCIRCHSHVCGFVHGCEGDCEGCHISHSTHTEHDIDDFRGPLPVSDCGDCHDKNNYQNFSDGKNLSETDVCNTCHSPNGYFNGVDTDVLTGSVGAKTNWETGIYQSNGTLTIGKEKWCAGCHDNVPSVVKDKTATDIAGDNTTYGYYLDAHGSVTYGVNRQEVADDGYSRGECLHCHDISVTSKLPPMIDESFEGNRYEETWTDTVCTTCTLNPDFSIPGTPPPGAGSQCLQSISASADPDPGYEAYAKRDYGSEQNKTFTRFYLYVDNVGLNNGENKKIGELKDKYGNNVFAFRLDKDSSGQLRFNLRLVYNNGSTYYDDYFNISSGTSAKWYRIEVKYDNTTGNAVWEWLVDGETQGGFTLTTGTPHYTGIQKWIFGFETSTNTKTGTIYFDLVAVRNDDWVGEEQITGMPLHGGKLFDTTDNFCFKCHDNTTTYATNAIVNRSYSYRAGGYTDDTANDSINYAFSNGSYHYLNDIKTFINGKWGYDTGSNPCAACHNPHSVQGDPANAPNDTKSSSLSTRGWLVSRPSQHATNYNNLWGDSTDEKMSNYTNKYQAPCRYPFSTSCTSFEPDGSSTSDGSNLFDTVSFCLDCHSQFISGSTGGKPAINWGVNGDVHGGSPSQTCCDKGDKRPPYDNAASNYVLSCLDCHEPHGSPNPSLLRQEVNGTLIPPIDSDKLWYFCRACHRNLATKHTGHIPSIDPDYGCGGCHGHGVNDYPKPLGCESCPGTGVKTF